LIVNTPDLARIDLNLLFALAELLEHESVTQAARALRRTQSATSHALARLREQFQDPLLVRSSTGMARTRRADELLPRVRKLLGDARQILTDVAPFDPRTARRRFVLAQSDYTQTVVLPQLLAHVAELAPGVDLHVVDLGHDLTRRLDAGAVDIAVHVIRHEGAGVLRRRLFTDDYCCAVRANSRLGRRKLSVEEFASLRHVLVAPTGTGRGVVDDALAVHGLTRRIAISVPQFLIAPILVSQSDLCVTLPKRVALPLVAVLSLRIFDPPLALPRLTVFMSWHERTKGDPAARWLRDLIVQIANERAPVRLSST
jgi:DNA-binding transcriptional LysR family regulator